VNVSELSRLSGDEVSADALFAAGLLKNASEPFKLLGHGDLTRAVVVKSGTRVSASAKAKIEAAGGRVED